MTAPIGDEHLKGLLHLLKGYLSRNQWAHINLARGDEVCCAPKVDLTRPEARDQIDLAVEKAIRIKLDALLFVDRNQYEAVRACQPACSPHRRPEDFLRLRTQHRRAAVL